MDLEQQYDKIYRYCYFKTHQREAAEDITQETFLRFLESSGYQDKGQSLHYLYTIARNLCVDDYRRRRKETLEDSMETAALQTMDEEAVLTQISVRMALEKLKETDRELLLLKYVNEVPVHVIGKMYGISRFAAYRRIRQAKKKLKNRLGKEEWK